MSAFIFVFTVDITVDVFTFDMQKIFTVSWRQSFPLKMANLGTLMVSVSIATENVPWLKPNIRYSHRTTHQRKY